MTYDVAERDPYTHPDAIATRQELLLQSFDANHVLARPTYVAAPDGYRAQRSYSIASAPGKATTNEFELAIEKYDDGEVSPFMHDVAQVDDLIELGGPIGGHFIWRPEEGNPMLFIGGGSGVAPFISMIRQRQQVNSQMPVALLFSARTREDLLYLDELSNIAASDDAFRLVLTLTREPGPHPFDREGSTDRSLPAPFLR